MKIFMKSLIIIISKFYNVPLHHIDRDNKWKNIKILVKNHFLDFGPTHHETTIF